MIECEVQNEGLIYENSQITFAQKGKQGFDTPDAREEILFVNDIRFCLENDVDYVIHSIYQGKQEILDLKRHIIEERDSL